MKSYIVGGLGGSGSRIIGEIFHTLHFDMGSRINKSYDNLDMFAASGYYHNINPFNGSNYPKFRKMFIKQIKNSYKNDINVIKEPNFHLFLPFLKKISDETKHEMKFIHIIRDGLYMMNSKNQNQYKRWHNNFPLKEKILKYKKLEFWHLANKLALENYKKLDFKFLIIKYDYLIKDPEQEVNKILKFIDRPNDLHKLTSLIAKIKTFKPNSKKEDINNIPTQLKNKMTGWI